MPDIYGQSYWKNLYAPKKKKDEYDPLEIWKSLESFSTANENLEEDNARLRGMTPSYEGQDVKNWMPTNVVSAFQEALKTSDNPGLMETRLNTAYYLSKTKGIPFDEAFSDMDALLEADYGKAMSPESGLEAVANVFKAGVINRQIFSHTSRLLDKFMTGTDYKKWEDAENDPDYKAVLELERLLPPEDVFKRSIPVEFAKNVMQVVPSWGESILKGGAVGTAAAGMTYLALGATLGTAVMPGVGTAAGALVAVVPTIASLAGAVFGATATIQNTMTAEGGAAFYDMMKFKDPVTGERINPVIAARWSKGYAGLASAVELMQMDEFFKPVMGLANQNQKNIIRSAMKASMKSVVDASARAGTMLRLMSSTVGQWLLDWGVSTAAETIEEDIQEGLNIWATESAKLITNRLDGTSISPATKQEILKRIVDTTLVSVQGMGLLQMAPASIRVFSQTKENKAEVAQETPKTPAEQKTEAFTAQTAAPVAEGVRYQSDASGPVPMLLMGDSQGKRLNSVQYEATPSESGDSPGTLKILGIESTERPNEARSMILELEKRYAGWDVQWEPTSPTEKALAGYLEKNNRRGAKAGLQWFASDIDVADSDAFDKAKKVLLNFRPDWNEQDVNDALYIAKPVAAAFQMPLADLIDKSIAPNVIAEERIIPETTQGAFGASKKVSLDGFVKTVIDLAPNANPSTVTHEIFHSFITYAQANRSIEPIAQFLAQAESAFGVENGNWQGAFKGWTDEYKYDNRSAEEAIAYGLEDYIRTGNAPNEEVKGIFERLAKFLYDLYQSVKARITLTPEITKFYDDLFTASPIADTITAPAATGETGGVLMQGQLAYHGSGADFDRFDSEYMGTGEGAQAFGWGHYLTTNEGIARGYAKKVGDDSNVAVLWGDTTFFEGNSGWQNEEGYFADEIESLILNDLNITKSVDATISSFEHALTMKNDYDDNLYYQGEEAERFKKAIQLLKENPPEIKKNRVLYSTEINPEGEDKWIDWNEPVPKEIIDKVKATAGQEGIELSDYDTTSGRNFYTTVSSILDPTGMFGGDKNASMFLSRAGITGIRFPAASGGRGDGSAGTNFVVFRDEDVAIRDKVLFQGQANQWIYKSQQTISEKMKGPMPGTQVLKMLQAAGVKADELKWTGLDEFLATDKKLTPAQVQEYIDANKVQIEEVEKTVSEDMIDAFLEDEAGEGYDREEARQYLLDDENAPKYDVYILPGGDNYREVLFTLPDKYKQLYDEQTRIDDAIFKTPSGSDERYALVEQAEEIGKKLRGIVSKRYKSPHWSEPNVLAHTRLDDRITSDGKMLFVEEIQSDWHQEGRKKGYAVANPEQAIADMWRTGQSSEGSVPPAPFSKTWHEFVFKRILRMAVEQGYDSVGWTTGEQQAERYDLSKQIDSIGYVKRGDEMYRLAVWGKEGEEVYRNDSVNPSEMENIIGKEMTQKVVDGVGRKEAGYTYLEDLDLKVGGEGMKGFYDKILVDFANKYGKKWGAQVQDKVLNDNVGWQIINAGTGINDSVPLYNKVFATEKEAEAYAEKNNDSYYEVLQVGLETVHYLPITDQMRESVMQGQVLFQGQTDTPAFKEWFGDSKVVDEQGKPLVVYHGSEQAGFDEFSTKDGKAKQSKMQLDFGSHFTVDPEYSSDYSTDKGAIYPTYLSIKNPLDLTDPNSYMAYKGTKQFEKLLKLRKLLGLKSIGDMFYDIDGNKKQEIQNAFINQLYLDSKPPQKTKQALLDSGFDGVIYTPYQQVGLSSKIKKPKSYIAFSPTQIKSVYNRGTWNPDDPRILYQGQLEDTAKAYAAEGKTWQEFMEFFETPFMEDDRAAFGIDDLDDEQKRAWYKAQFEKANAPADDTPPDLAAWVKTLADNGYTKIKTFLGAIYDEVIKVSEDAQPEPGSDPEEIQAFLAKRQMAQDYRTQLADPIIAGALAVGNVRPVSPKFLASVHGIIRKNPEEYARILGDITGDEKLSAQGRIAESQKYADIPRPVLEKRMSITETAKVAEGFRDEVLRKKVLAGEATNAEFVAHAEKTDKQLKDTAKQLAEKEGEIRAQEAEIGAQGLAIAEQRAELKKVQTELDTVLQKMKKYQAANADIPPALESQRTSIEKRRDGIRKKMEAAGDWLELERQVKNATERERYYDLEIQKAKAQGLVPDPADVQARSNARSQVRELKAKADSYKGIKNDAKLLEYLSRLDERTKLQDERRLSEAEARAAKQMLDYRKKLADYISKPITDDSGTSRTVHYKIAEKIRDIQASFNPEFLTNRSQKVVDELREKLFADSTLAAVTNKKWLKRAFGRNLNELNLKELEDTAAEIAYLRDVGKIMYEAVKEQRMADTAYNKAMVQAGLEQVPGYEAKSGYDTTTTFMDSVTDKLTKFDFAFTNMRRVSRTMDGGTDGQNVELLINRERTAYRTEMEGRESRMKPLMAYLKDKPVSEYARQKIMIPGAGARRDEVVLKKSEMLGLVMALKDENSARAAIFGNFFSERERKTLDKETLYAEGDRRLALVEAAISKNMTEADYKMLEFFEQDAKEVSPRLAEVVGKVENRIMETVENYFPILRKGVGRDEPISAQVGQELLDRVGGLRRSPAKGMTFKRVEISPANQTAIELDLFKVWPQSIARQEHYMAYAEYGKVLDNTYLAPEVQETIVGALGDAGKKYVEDYIAEVKNPAAMNPAWDSGLRMLRGNVGFAYLAFRMSSVLKQLVTSPWPALPYAGARLFTEAGKAMINPVGYVRDVESLSTVLRHRTIDQILEAIKNAKIDTKFAEIWQKYEEVGMKGLEWADRISVAIGWRAIYEKALLEFDGDTQKAIAKADDIILSTQPSARGVDLPPIYRNKNEFTKIVLQFTQALNVIYQNIFKDIPAAVQAHDFKTAVGITTAYMIAGALLTAMTTRPSDDKDDEWKRWLWGSTTQFTDSLPLLGEDVTRLMKRVMTGEKDPALGDTLFPGASKIFGGMNELVDGDMQDALLKLGEGFGTIFGQPTSAVKEALRVIEGDPGALLGRPRE